MGTHGLSRKRSFGAMSRRDGSAPAPYGGSSIADGSHDAPWDEPLTVYKIQVEKLSGHGESASSNINEKNAPLVQREDPSQFLRWQSQRDQDEAKRRLRRKRKAAQTSNKPTSHGTSGGSSSSSNNNNNEAAAPETNVKTMQDVVDALLAKRIREEPLSELVFDKAAFECGALSKTDFPEVKMDVGKVAAAAAGKSRRRKSMRVARAAAAQAPTSPLKLVTMEDLKTFAARSRHQGLFSGAVVADLFRR